MINQKEPTSPTGYFVLGGIFFTIALVFGLYHYISYINWQEVTYEARDLGCSSRAHDSGSLKGKTCTVEYKYTYDGQSYSVVSTMEKSSRGRKSSFYIDPKDPEKHINHYSLEEVYSLADIGCGIGVLMALYGLLKFLISKRRSLKHHQGSEP